ncbi:MAG: polyphosphate kinase 1 [Eubacteriales bacterium]|nr:polyphosphate kinase 1 [Eubacteriales bacterium]
MGDKIKRVYNFDFMYKLSSDTQVDDGEINITNDKKSKKEKNKKPIKVKREFEPYYDNRELSWLKFNERVLEEAADRQVPLCERLTFVTIFSSNLDEFYMVRVGSLYDQMIADNARENKTHMTASEQLVKIYKRTENMYRQRDSVYTELMHEVEDFNVKIVSFSDVEPVDAAYLELYFKKSVLPVLSPQVIGTKQPFPFLRNKDIYAVALLGNKNNDKVAVVPCSNDILKRLVPLQTNKNHYMLVEELILHFMPLIFSNYTIKSKSLIRIIRNADIDVDEAFYDQDLDYRNSMERLIRERRRLCPVKMAYSRMLDEKVINTLCSELKIGKQQVFHSETPLDQSFLFQIQDSLRSHKELFYERRVPQSSRYVENSVSMIKQIEKNDILLSYPFENMAPFIRMLNEASEDFRVVSIKMTLYRVAKNSQIIEALINAAENGKEVVVLVELRARFDEENNIEWSRRLEDAGCRIIYGIDFIKVHSKLCLITYQDEGELKYITQIGTGNYNEKTSKLYTDLSLITADKAIAVEANEVFQNLCMGQVMEETHELLASPKCLQNRVMEFIDKEIQHRKNGEAAYIGLKMNSVTDKKIIDKLIEASKAGVHIDMVIRGICCVIPGIAGATDNIHVRSIVGRYLEHSRIYIFGTGERERIYISSADFMTRNTEKRVEIAAPVKNSDLRQRIHEMFDIFMKDNVKARILMPDGIYKKRVVQEGEPRINSQEYFFEEAYEYAAKKGKSS